MRGVSSDYAIIALTKAHLIEVVGVKDTIGRPQLYGTTDEFLKKFELKSLDDLPDLAEVMSKIQTLYNPQQETLFSNRTVFGEEVPEAQVVEQKENKPFVDPFNTEVKDATEEDEIPYFLEGEEDINVIE